MGRILAIAGAIALFSVPAQAADLSGGEFRTGGFIGARLRLPLGTNVPTKPEAGLTIAMTQSYRSPTGRTVTRLGEGLGVDFASGKPALTLRGVPADLAFGLRQQGRVDPKAKLGISSGAWIAIGAVVAVAAVVAVTQLTCVGKDKDFCGSD